MSGAHLVVIIGASLVGIILGAGLSAIGFWFLRWDDALGATWDNAPLYFGAGMAGAVMLVVGLAFGG